MFLSKTVQKVLTPANAASRVARHMSLVVATQRTLRVSSVRPHLLQQRVRLPAQSFGLRQFSSSPVGPDEDKKLTIRERYEKNVKPHMRTYAVYGGMIIGSVLTMNVGLGVVNFFGTLDFYDVGKAAFGMGAVSTLTVMGLFYAGSRALVLRPEPIYRACLRRVLRDPTVTAKLGNSARSGHFRAYSFVDGSLRLQAEKGRDYSGWQRFWQPRKLQIMFQLQSDNGHAMVSAEVEKDARGNHKYNSLALSMLDTGERFVLEGDGEVVFQNVLKLR